jgi:O-antigen/teichoic acid export membrane protein
MLSKNTIYTIGSKFIILLANFGLVAFSSRIWGSEGRGIIALVMANVSVIVIFSNVFCGSSLTYNTPREERDFLLLLSFISSIVISLAGAIIFSFLFGFTYFMPLFIIAMLMSLTTANASYMLGKKDITLYNTLTVLGPVTIIITLLILYFLFLNKDIDTYFHAYYIGTAIVAITGFIILQVRKPFVISGLRLKNIKNIFFYGVNNEFNYLIQFLNYRLSYYFIARMLGLSLLGVFSIAVSITEAVWIISRSMSTIHYSNVVNSDDKIRNRSETIRFAKQSLWISIAVILIGVALPVQVYQFVFGTEFIDVKKYIIMLSPGVISIAVSNLYGHYFAGIGMLNILRNKSLAGLVATLLLLPVLIKKYQLTGVCITLNVSYILSSFYLWYKFRQEAKHTT